MSSDAVPELSTVLLGKGTGPFRRGPVPLPELSIIVPVYNEEAEIPRFLSSISLQREIRFELIVSDGGSTDQTVPLARKLSVQLDLPITVVEGGKGRARQMNAGSAAAGAAILLFLHIDSILPDPLSLRKGVDALSAAAGGGATNVAGHFALRFDFDEDTPLPYRFYSAKASLDRPGCTHGDQGLLIPAPFFRDLGFFDPALPLMEDTLLAERIREKGRWLLLPAPIRTSPRRFLTEGLLPRQFLNGILMILAFTGRFDLIESLRECYRSQDAAQRLKLYPFLKTLREKIAALPLEERKRLWGRTGAYVRSNAWQIPFFFDVVVGEAEGGKGRLFLALHDGLVAKIIANGVGDRIAAGLAWGCFRTAFALSYLRR